MHRRALLLAGAALALLAGLHAGVVHKGSGGAGAGAAPSKSWRLELAGSTIMPYIGRIELGTPARQFSVLWDTGSAATLVLGPGLTLNGEPFGARHAARFDGNASSSFRWHEDSFEIAYTYPQFESLHAKALTFFDTVRLLDGREPKRPLLIEAQQIGLVRELSAGPEPELRRAGRLPADVLAGLSHPWRDSDDVTSLFVSFVLRELLDEQVFALFTYPRRAGFQADAPRAAELSLGAIDKLRYTGEIAWAPLARTTGWRVRVHGMRVQDGGGAPAAGPLRACAHGCDASVRSGVSYIAGPREEIGRLNGELGFKLLPGPLDSVELYAAPGACAEHLARHGRKSLALDLGLEGARALALEPEALMWEETTGSGNGTTTCVSALRSSHHGHWTLGAPFVSSFYMVFDYANQKVGFAQAVRPRSLRS